MFVGRQSELKLLENRFSHARSEFIVLYGRRRIGKTELLRQFCNEKRHIFYSCMNTGDALQLQRFSEAILKAGHPAASYLSSFSDWETAFSALKELSSQSRLVFVIDEFPYMCRENPAIPSILQTVWDTTLKNANIMLIICGSSMSFMEKRILSEKNPLYGRASSIMKLEQLDFWEAMEFFPAFSSDQKIEAYSILGGIPYYLEQWEDNLSTKENILENILAPGCLMYNEVTFSLAQELREPRIYNDILFSVAAGSSRISDITSKAMLINTAKASVYLKNLTELGLVERRFSVDSGPKERSNQNRGYYLLSDFYFRFWFRYVFPNFSLLEQKLSQQVYAEAIEPTLNQYCSLAFEEICHQYMYRLMRQNRLPFSFSRIGHWFGKTLIHDSSVPRGYRLEETELDLMAPGFDGKHVYIGECKYKNSPFTWNEYLNLRTKSLGIAKDQEIMYVLFSKSGFEQKLLDEASAQSVLLFTLDELVQG